MATFKAELGASGELRLAALTPQRKGRAALHTKLGVGRILLPAAVTVHGSMVRPAAAWGPYENPVGAAPPLKVSTEKRAPTILLEEDVPWT